MYRILVLSGSQFDLKTMMASGSPEIVVDKIVEKIDLDALKRKISEGINSPVPAR